MEGGANSEDLVATEELGAAYGGVGRRGVGWGGGFWHMLHEQFHKQFHERSILQVILLVILRAILQAIP